MSIIMSIIVVIIVIALFIFLCTASRSSDAVEIERKAVRRGGHIREALIVRALGQEVYIILTRSGYMGVAPKDPRGGPTSWTDLRRGRTAEVDPDGEVRIRSD